MIRAQGPDWKGLKKQPVSKEKQRPSENLRNYCSTALQNITGNSGSLELKLEELLPPNRFLLVKASLRWRLDNFSLLIMQ